LDEFPLARLSACNAQAGRARGMDAPNQIQAWKWAEAGKAIVAHEFCSGSGIRNVELNPQDIYVASKLVVLKNELCFMQRIGEAFGMSAPGMEDDTGATGQSID